MNGDHGVILTPADADLEIQTTCLWCGAIGRNLLPRSAELLPLSGAAPDALVEGIAEAARLADKPAEHLTWFRRFRQEGLWLFLGTAIGATVPAGIWLAYEPRLLIPLLLVVFVGLLWLSNRLIKMAELNMPRQGWSLAGILVAARSKSTSSRRLSNLAAIFTAAAILGVGIMFGIAVTVGVYLAPV